MTSSSRTSAAAGSGSPYTPHSDADDVRRTGHFLWRHRVAFVVVAGALSFFGFAVVTPAAKTAAVAGDLAAERAARLKKDEDHDSAIARLERRQDHQEQMLESNNAAWCVTLTPREAKLARLNCESVEGGR